MDELSPTKVGCRTRANQSKPEPSHLIAMKPLCQPLCKFYGGKVRDTNEIEKGY